MNFLKVLSAVLLGFVLGILLGHPRPAKAALSNITLIEIRKGYNPTVQVGEIIGFACTADACYLASR